MLALTQAVALAALAAAALGAGRVLTRRLPTAGRAEATAVAAAVGLGALSTVAFVLGLLGALERWAVLAVAAAAVAALAATAIRGRPAPRPPPATRWRLAAVACAAALLPTFLWSLYPPIGYDAGVYHLPFARAFAAAHRLVVVPDVVFPVFPQLAEVLFAGMMLATGRDVAAHLVQLLALGLIALLLFAAAARFWSRRAGWWAAALWLAHPLAHYQGASAYVDLVLALFCLLALYAWELWRSGAGRGWLAVAAAAAGFAAGVKYLGLAWLAVLAAATLVAGPKRRRLAGTLALVAGAAVVAAPWYLRILWETGDPLYPFLGPLLAGGEGSLLHTVTGLAPGDQGGDLLATAARLARELVRRPLELAVFAFQASFVPGAFSRQSPIAPWHLALVPLALVFSRRDPRLPRWVAVAVAYALPWTTVDPRYHLSSAAVLALVSAGGLEHLAARVPAVGRRLARPAVALGLAAALTLPGPLYATYKVGKLGFPPPVTRTARLDFLDRMLPGHPAIRLLDRRHGDRYTVFVLGAPDLTVHARGRVLGHVHGPTAAGRAWPLLHDGEALHRELRSMGADHLLLVGRGSPPPAIDAPADRFALLAAGPQYRLYALRPAPTPERIGAAPPG